MIGWLFNLAYVALLVVVSPVLVWRAISQGKYRDGWGEKLTGRLPASVEDERVVWLHAVSVGEVLQLRTIVDQLHQTSHELTILITTTTVTGRSVAAETFPQCRIAYCPLDFTWAVRQALQRVRPLMIGLIELELWPNLIREASALEIPLMLINGRMSPRSYRGYRRIRPLVRSLLERFQIVAVQTREYADRLVKLGAPPDRVHVTGSIKFDGVQIAGLTEQTNALRSAFGVDDAHRVFIAGSTHEPEEEIALHAWMRLRGDHPDLRLLLVPRHKERFDEVAALIERQGLVVRRRSQMGTATSPEDDAVLLLDTLGELSACWALADVAFVGGSLTKRGGQNMIEPAAHGVPVISGPNTTNFRDVVEGLQSVGGIELIGQPSELAGAVSHMLTDHVRAERQATAAQQFVAAQRGAKRRTMELMQTLLEGNLISPVRRAA